MKSFRTELENPIIEKDILELERKIFEYKNGKVDEERFRSLRLARGVYGQRQEGVQMIRIKIPYGKLTTRKLRRIASVADEYSTGNLHITTRQDIQIHYVSLDRTPELWADLEKDEVTLREACGNTVRNVTASHSAGIDPKEVFDVTEYADAFFKFFLRNPICQDMGRKFKVAFSATDEDDYLSFAHDLGFIPKLNEKGERGFKVLVGGGMGSQPFSAFVAYEFLPTDKIIPFGEAVLRVFEKHGERASRMKARMKFLLKKIGAEAFMELVASETKALSTDSFPIEPQNEGVFIDRAIIPFDGEINEAEFSQWKSINVKAQKQTPFFSVGVKVRTGDFSTDTARALAVLVDKYADDDIRLTIGQSLTLRFVREENLKALYLGLKELNFVDLGFNGLTDIIACPGTDTCNLGIASSMGLAKVVEPMILDEFPQFLTRQDLSIKISGCMNSCGQHMIASIGLQGMTIKVGKLVAPATQILLGGGILGDGEGRYADKVIKIPAKRVLDALRILFNDIENGQQENEAFLDYYDRKGKIYFYDLLKEIASTENMKDTDYIDWGNAEKYKKEIGVGECAGVVIDLVSTLLFEAEEALEWSVLAIEEKKYADAIFYAYNGMVRTAKALLTGTKSKINSHAKLIHAFDVEFPNHVAIKNVGFESYESLVNQMKEHKPDEFFATKYLNDAKGFIKQVQEYRAVEKSIA